MIEMHPNIAWIKHDDTDVWCPFCCLRLIIRTGYNNTLVCTNCDYDCAMLRWNESRYNTLLFVLDDKLITICAGLDNQVRTHGSSFNLPLDVKDIETIKRKIRLWFSFD